MCNIAVVYRPTKQKWWAFASCTIQRHCHTHTTYKDTKPTKSHTKRYDYSVGVQCIVPVVFENWQFSEPSTIALNAIRYKMKRT